jgi:hypothetical protein
MFGDGDLSERAVPRRFESAAHRRVSDVGVELRDDRACLVCSPGEGVHAGNPEVAASVDGESPKWCRSQRRVQAPHRALGLRTEPSVDPRSINSVV